MASIEPDDAIQWQQQSRKGMDEESRAFFERLVETFPLTGRFWKIYIEQEVV